MDRLKIKEKAWTIAQEYLNRDKNTFYSSSKGFEINEDYDLTIECRIQDDVKHFFVHVAPNAVHTANGEQMLKFRHFTKDMTRVNLDFHLDVALGCLEDKILRC